MQVESGRMFLRRGVQGFTLIEVMVALFIAGMAITALLIKSMTIMDSTGYLHKKTVAHWVALNQIEREQLASRNSNVLPVDEKQGSEEMANQKWFWRIKPVKTANDGFLQLQVKVSDQPEGSLGDNDSLVTVTGLVDRYHKRQKRGN